LARPVYTNEGLWFRTASAVYPNESFCRRGRAGYYQTSVSPLYTAVIRRVRPLLYCDVATLAITELIISELIARWPIPVVDFFRWLIPAVLTKFITL